MSFAEVEHCWFTDDNGQAILATISVGDDDFISTCGQTRKIFCIIIIASAIIIPVKRVSCCSSCNGKINISIACRITGSVVMCFA